MTFEITIPVLNEEDRLSKGIEKTLQFFKEQDMSNWKIVIADNGSTDNTAEIAQEYEKKNKNIIRYIHIPQKGVGLALRHSWTSTTCDIVGYMDVDLATDLKHLKDAESIFKTTNAKVVNGSRLLNGSKVEGRTILREFTSRSLNYIMNFLLQVKFTDAMCGFKFFHHELAKRLFEEIPIIPDWFISAEMLVKSEWHNISIHEIPIHWTDEPNSKVNIKKLTKQYLDHIFRLRKEKNQWRD
jgi:glycosyltransferase involved in cell wall biosynthesis